MAQRMESVAPPGGVMLSASTARLVEGAAALGEPEMVRIKGADEPVSAHRLLGMGERHRARRACRVESGWSAVGDVRRRGLVGPCDRWPRRCGGRRRGRLVSGKAVWCASFRPWHLRVVSRCSLPSASRTPARFPSTPSRGCLRVAFGVEGLDTRVARDGLRDRIADADPEDLLLLDDLLGITDPDVELPKIDPDARRRRLTALVNAASLARETPAVYVVEDAHWIDEVSESMLADFLTVIPQTPSLVLVTYRPEYEGALTRVHGAQTIALAPLSDSETAALVAELLGPDPSVGGLGQTIAERAAGNPFFAEEIVRELAERGVLRGEPGAYVSTAEVAEVSCARHVAGDHRRAHRSARPEGETHVERSGGHRVAVQPRPADDAWHRTGRRRPGGGRAHRSGQVHPSTPSMCSTIR